MGACNAKPDQEDPSPEDAQCARLAAGKAISVDCQILTGGLEETVSVRLNSQHLVSEAKKVIMEQSGYEHKAIVVNSLFAEAVVVKVGDSVLTDEQTLADEGVEDGATLTVIVDTEVISFSDRVRG